MDKTQDAFRTIGEVAEELDLPQHVLRFWETKFSQIRPVKRVGGRRYYRPEDIQLVAAIRVLLYSEGYTIRGVQRILKEQGARALVAASRANGRAAPLDGPGDDGKALAASESALAEPSEGLAAALASDLPPASDSPDLAPVSALNLDSPESAAPGATRLSAQDRHRMEAILVELAEGGRILEDARRR